MTTYLPWAIRTAYNSNFIMNVYFEKRWDQPIEDLHQELNIKLLPKTTKSAPKKDVAVVAH